MTDQVLSAPTPLPSGKNSGRAVSFCTWCCCFCPQLVCGPLPPAAMAPGQLGELLGALVEPRHRPPCPAAPSPWQWRRPDGSCGALTGWGGGAAVSKARARPLEYGSLAADPTPGQSLSSGDHKIRECPLQTAPPPLDPLGFEAQNVLYRE